MAKAVAQDLGVRFVPITMDTSGKRRKYSIGGIAEADVTAVPGRNDKEIVIDTLPDDSDPLVIARSSRTVYKDHDIQLDVSGKTAGYRPFTLSSA